MEIGPGEGALTELIAPRVKELIGVEIDRDLVDTLLANKALSGCTFLRQDFLDIDLSSLPFSERTVRVVGNIPYSITSPIIFKLLEQPSRWKDIHLMVQKEVADRLTALAGNKTYGRLTIMVQAFMEVRQVLIVPPDVFIPKPKVHSAVVYLKAHQRFHLNDDTLNVFGKIVRVAFSQRRKMLKNSLRDLLHNLENEIDIDLSRRPETLSVEEFINLTSQLSYFIK